MNIKNYKGLGTSTSNEAKDYFRDLKINQYITNEDTDGSMVLAFKKTEADQRKSWLKTYKEEEILDYNCKETKITDFINREFKHFSNSDNMRSIMILISHNHNFPITKGFNIFIFLSRF